MIETLDAESALQREHDMLGRVSDNPNLRFLWFWQAEKCLVVPRKLSTQDGFEVASKEMASHGWPVFVRGTGGDVTPQGQGIVNVTHVYAAPKGIPYEIENAYDDLCTPIENALGPGASRGWQPGAFCDGAHNVQWQGRKFAGTAMRFRPLKSDRSRRAVLAHALMLFEPPTRDAINALNHFLTLMAQNREINPAAHAGLPAPVSPEAFVQRLTDQFGRVSGVRNSA